MLNFFSFFLHLAQNPNRRNTVTLLFAIISDVKRAKYFDVGVF